MTYYYQYKSLVHRRMEEMFRVVLKPYFHQKTAEGRKSRVEDNIWDHYV